MKYALVEFCMGGQLYTYSCDDRVKKGSVVKVPVEGYPTAKLVVVKRTTRNIPKTTPAGIKIKSIETVVSDTIKHTVFDIPYIYSFSIEPQVVNAWNKSKCVVKGIYNTKAYFRMDFQHKDIEAFFGVFRFPKNKNRGVLEVYFCPSTSQKNTNGEFLLNELYFSCKHEMQYILYRIKKAVYDYSIGKLTWGEAVSICSDPNDIIPLIQQQ